MNRKLCAFFIAMIVLITFIPSQIIRKDQTFLPSKDTEFHVKDGQTNLDAMPTPRLLSAVDNLKYIIEDSKKQHYGLDRHAVKITFDPENYFRQMEYLRKNRLLDKEFFTYCTDTTLQKTGEIKATKIEEAIESERLLFYTIHKSGKTYTFYQEGYKYKFIDISMPQDKKLSEKECKKMLRNYISYLGLDYLDDWIYKNQSYYSEKGDGALVLMTQDQGVLRLWLERYHY